MRIILAFLFCLLFYSGFAQGVNNLWMMGHSNGNTIPFGGNEINFKTGAPVISYTPREMNFSRTSANMSDKEGNLLFATNGIYIADRAGNRMQNGGGLNLEWIDRDDSIYGLPGFQAALIIPKPSDTAIYYLFHNSLDHLNPPCAKQLLLTTIDMRLNGGLGAVTAKNQPIVTDTLSTGQLTAVKHANGRDWWISCHKAYSNGFYKILLTPDGLSSPVQQAIGEELESIGQVVFSPDGSRFAFYDAFDGLQILDFDRCLGIWYNSLHFIINDTTFGGGVAFSPDSKLLYVASTYYVYQFDLTASNIAASQQIVATYDGWHEPNIPALKTLFEKCMLAPDDKIYISTGNGSRFLHVINNPNVLGTGCNLVQRGVELPSYYFNSLPNHPNYHLGALSGSPCDTLVSATEPVQVINIQLYPNPNNGDFSINFAPQPEQGELQVYDVLGKLVYKEQVAAWSQQKRLSQPLLAKGVYHCRLSWGEKTGTVRFVKQ